MSDESPRSAAPIGRRRWTICALLFLATTINYVDRQIIGILKPTLSAEFGWTERDYGEIVFWFQVAYAIGLLGVGRLIDRVGVRWGYSIAVAVWSVAAIAHATARTVTGFAFARLALGVGEAGNFPAAVKATAEWFPRRERAFATGVFNAGSNVGAILSSLLVPPMVFAFGWQAAFVVTGSLGLFWLFAWLIVYRPPGDDPRVSVAELRLIRSDPPEPEGRETWGRLLRYRQSWAFILAKLMTDPIWYFLLFWLPDFLAKQYGLNLTTFGPPLIAIYLLADVGSIGGGWMSSRLIGRGWTVNAGRKTTMLLCALCVTPISLAVFADELWVAVGVIGLAAAAHQGWSANLFTLASDLMPKPAVASLVGLGGMAGAVGGMLMARYVGAVLDDVGSYVPIFLAIGSMYLLALLVVHLLSPRLKPAILQR